MKELMVYIFINVYNDLFYTLLIWFFCKSECSEFKCLCIKVKRDKEIELKEDL